MADEPSEAPEETQDTLTSAAEVAAESGPQDTPETPVEQQPGESNVDYEKRYKDLQAEYTKTAQENAEFRRAQEASTAERQMEAALTDPETQAQAMQSLIQQLGGEDEARAWLEQHGFEVEDDDETDDEFRDPRVDQLLSEREAERQNAQVEQIEKDMESKLTELATGADVELSDKVRNLILDAAVSRWTGNPATDVQSVFEEWNAEREAAIKAYRAQKRTSQSTPPVPRGSGTPNPSHGNAADRLALANAIAEEAQQSA